MKDLPARRGFDPGADYEGKTLHENPPCAFCGTPTAPATLSSFGARCGQCFAAYLRQPRPTPDVGDKKRNGPRDWARALKRRHEAGATLTPVQVAAYRSVVGAAIAIGDGEP